MMSQTQLWRLSDDQRAVRLHLPPLKLPGLKRPLELQFDFEADVIDQILRRLTELRMQMLPPPQQQ